MVDQHTTPSGSPPQRRPAVLVVTALLLVAFATGFYILQSRAKALFEMSQRADAFRTAPPDVKPGAEPYVALGETCVPSCTDERHCEARWVQVKAGAPARIAGSSSGERRHGSEYTERFAVLKPADLGRRLSARTLSGPPEVSAEGDPRTGVLRIPFSSLVELSLDSGEAEVALFDWSCGSR